MREAIAPDYHDWFRDLKALEVSEKIELRTELLPLESSRGCWWGEHHHCTFCGIDEESMKYRSKGAEQVLSEIKHLRDNYGVSFPYRFTDNIFPHRFHQTLLPELARLNPKPALECEIKANQTSERIGAFARAGFVAMQPGIESFSSPVLNRMNKGVRSIQNVQLLKWGYLNKIIIAYNLLYGFPDDQPEDYRWLVENLPRLYHFMLPASCTEVAMTRFAPLSQSGGAGTNVDDTKSHWFYRVLFSREFIAKTGFNINNYCYYFERTYDFSYELKILYSQIGMQFRHWQQQPLTRHVALSYSRSAGRIHFMDTRFGTAKAFTIDGLAAEIYALCDDQAIGVETILRKFAANAGASPTETEMALAELDANRVVWRSDDMIFGLGVPHEVTRARWAERWQNSWPGLAEILSRKLYSSLHEDKSPVSSGEGMFA